MSDLTASVSQTTDGFHVAGYEKIEYDFVFIDNIFNPSKSDLADCYKKWGRCLAVMDMNIFNLYGEKMQEYFDHYDIDLSIHKTMIGEKAKNLDTFTSLVDSFNKFGLIRKEPVLVCGGGLVTDVAGFACAAYRRSSNYIRIPTTVIGLIDASVSIKVAVNYGEMKNRLGAYHAPAHTFLDFTFLRTLPEAQIRNGFAELIKISSCADLTTFDLLDQHCEDLIATGFGRKDEASEKTHTAADMINKAAIHEMLKLETPNLHEIGLDRVIAYGHTWSPLHELVPQPPLRHGHAISIDMAYSATLANIRGLLSDAEHKRMLNLFSKAGLSMDHPQFDEDMLDRGTKAIMKTRDGMLRAAVPSPIGSCVFLNDVTADEMNAALKKHKEILKGYPRNGEGLEAYVDASDTGYTMLGQTPETTNGNGDVNGLTNGHTNGTIKANVLNDDTASSSGCTSPSTKATSVSGEDEVAKSLELANPVNGENPR